MTWEQAFVHRAKMAKRYAEDGFEASVSEAVGKMATADIDAIPDILEALLEEYEVVKEARKDYENAVERYGMKEAE